MNELLLWRCVTYVWTICSAGWFGMGLCWQNGSMVLLGLLCLLPAAYGIWITWEEE